MKTCPACQTQYTDDTLQFCLQDGSPLSFARQSDTPTAVLKDMPSWQQSQATHVGATQPQKKSKMAIAVVATVLIMLVLFGVVGIGAWLYFRNPQTETANNISAKANVPIQLSNTNVLAYSTPQISTSVMPSSTRTTNTSVPSADESQAQREVSQRLISWKSSAESLDLDGNISHYAGIVDYYNKSNSTVAFVRADKLKAFTRYESINIKLTNISISVNETGEKSTVTFDKEWNFEGVKNSAGKVKQLMKLNKINGQWLITAEKDAKVYFTR